MKIKFPACLACAAALATLVTVDHAQVAATPTPTPAAPGRRAGHGQHPAIHAAIRALERAKEDLQLANHDFGGHRADAIAACDTALAQLRLALQYANGNGSATGPEPTPTPTP